MGVSPLTADNRAVFLDRDGVLNQAIVRNGKPFPPLDVSEMVINPDARIGLPLLKRLGFSERIRGDHYIFTRDGVAEILNLQPVGHSAKAYQVKQVRKVIVQYKLGEDV